MKCINSVYVQNVTDGPNRALDNTYPLQVHKKLTCLTNVVYTCSARLADNLPAPCNVVQTVSNFLCRWNLERRKRPVYPSHLRKLATSSYLGIEWTSPYPL